MLQNNANLIVFITSLVVLVPTVVIGVFFGVGCYLSQRVELCRVNELETRVFKASQIPFRVFAKFYGNHAIRYLPIILLSAYVISDFRADQVGHVATNVHPDSRLIIRLAPVVPVASVATLLCVSMGFTRSILRVMDERATQSIPTVTAMNTILGYSMMLVLISILISFCWNLLENCPTHFTDGQVEFQMSRLIPSSLETLCSARHWVMVFALGLPVSIAILSVLSTIIAYATRGVLNLWYGLIVDNKLGQKIKADPNPMYFVVTLLSTISIAFITLSLSVNFSTLF